MPAHQSDISTELLDLLATSEPMTYRQLGAALACTGRVAIAAPAEYELVRRTLDNLARRGRVARCGRQAGMTLFILPSTSTPTAAAGA